MSHSKQLREYRLTDHGVELIQAYVGPEGVLTGTARMVQEARERGALLVRQQAIAKRKREVERKREVIERQIADLHASLEAEEVEIAMQVKQEQERESQIGLDRNEMAVLRGAKP